MKLPIEQAKSLLVLGVELDVSLGGHTAESIRERIRTLSEYKIDSTNNP
jgi:DNA repair ATPase RecN